MKFQLHKDFKKQYEKLNEKKQEKFKKQLKIFSQNQFDPVLNNHPLKGKYLDCRSINVAGDLRAIYKYTGENKCIFLKIGSHSKLYS